MIRSFPVLRQYMREHGVCWEELAAVAEMDMFTFHLKMWGIRRWKLPEVVRICCFFRTPNAEHLFCTKTF
jgi:hypothetical protein